MSGLECLDGVLPSTSTDPSVRSSRTLLLAGVSETNAKLTLAIVAGPLPSRSFVSTLATTVFGTHPTDETGEWEIVVTRPSEVVCGKLAHARVQKVGERGASVEPAIKRAPKVGAPGTVSLELGSLASGGPRGEPSDLSRKLEGSASPFLGPLAPTPSPRPAARRRSHPGLGVRG